MCKSTAKPKFTNLIEVMMHFSDNEICKEYLASMRWSNGVICPHCQNEDKIYTMKKGYKCAKCRKPFSVTKGTIFENSAIPLQKWFAAIWFITSNKKGVSSLQLSRHIGITQKSAWFMLQRIRFAIRTKSFNKPLDDIVEIDETLVGGKNKNRHASKKLKKSQGGKGKSTVFGLVERNGRLVAMRVRDRKRATVMPIIHQTVSKDVKLMTDEHKAYANLSTIYDHEMVNHGEGQYVVGACHTNTIEGFWSLLKRGIIGIYHNVSEKHLDAYVDEFEFRYNTKNISCIERFDKMLALSDSRISYKRLIN
ncbi:IS1595 family transposase [Flavivirga abyssicola]|uniref:IS1595 family transposase n=1 Tax=Flavivirga abyssicola TaxID=3063533 RepID=UPI0026E0723B|nr:IS1595 family transposase [Flavivirga sp. MEBiC07777]WVK15164.1 IS1595 family transposase [Flavivirga sp. MEBiC07777]